MRVSISAIASVACATLFGGCGGDATAGQPIDPGTQYIIGIDLSASRPKKDVIESRQLLDDLLRTQIKNGDQVIIVEMYGDDFRARGQSVVGALFAGAENRKIQHTDILGTLARAGDYAKSAAGRRSTILLLSDMENSTAELEMAGLVPSGEWIKGRKQANRLPDLGGVYVVISGTAATTAHGAKVRQFWQDYFTETGAKLPASNYRDFVADAGQVHC